ncbi:MAG: DUF4159 domain-containing protein [Elusimicrobiota bacterium]|jgi:hypothetical protein
MIFTSPGVLWAAPLAAIPLLLHLLSRRRARKVDFSDLTLLRRVLAQALPRTRLRQWLLAAARSGLLLSLILAYAGPVFEGAAVCKEVRPDGACGISDTAGAGDGLDLVLLLDASYSMGVVDRGRTRHAAARGAAAELLRSLRSGDRVACAVFTDRLEGADGRLVWMSPGECADLFGRSSPGWRGTDFLPALRAADELLQPSSGRRDRAVVLLSDGAGHGLREPRAPWAPGIYRFALDWPPAPANAAVAAAGPDRKSSPDKPVLRAAWWACCRGDSVLDLWQDRVHLSAGAVQLREREETSCALALPPAADAAVPEWHGRVELRPDALPADDAFFYSFQHARRPRLLALHGSPAFLKSPAAGYFLKELFGGAKGRLLEWDADFLGLERLAGNEPGGLRLSDYDAVAVADFQSVPPAAAAAIELFVRRGGGLWILPGARTDEHSLGALADWAPARIGTDTEAGFDRGFRVDKATGAFQFWRDFELDKVAWGRRLGLVPRPGAVVWLQTASGQPLLVSGGHGEGRVAVWAVPLDAVSGNLPVKPVFAALVPAIMSLLRPPAGRAEAFSLKVDEPIVRVWGQREAAPARVRVVSPDGRNTSLAVAGRKVEYALTQKPGLYSLVEENGGRSRVYAVNLDRTSAESDLRPAASPPWRALGSETLSRDFWLQVRGRDGRGAAVAAAVMLLVLEMILALPRAAMVLGLFLVVAAPVSAQQGDRFVWTQLKLSAVCKEIRPDGACGTSDTAGAGWDPYPDAPREITDFVGAFTSILVHPERRVITLKDPELFYSPLVVLAGREAPPELDAEDIKRLRGYLAAGGMLWIEDTSGSAASSFDRWVRRTLQGLLPEAGLQPLDNDNVLFRTFFFLRSAYGRVMVRGTLEGVPWGGRTAVVYSRNDLLGVWIKDPLGRPLLPCLPGGEAQRHNARKLALNIIMYSLTGSYKADAVHQPYLLQKMRSGAP